MVWILHIHVDIHSEYSPRMHDFFCMLGVCLVFINFTFKIRGFKLGNIIFWCKTCQCFWASSPFLQINKILETITFSYLLHITVKNQRNAGENLSRCFQAREGTLCQACFVLNYAVHCWWMVESVFCFFGISACSHGNLYWPYSMAKFWNYMFITQN